MVKSSELPGSDAYNRRAAAQFTLMCKAFDVTQVALAASLHRSTGYVGEQWRGGRPLGLDLLEHAAALAGEQPNDFLFALAVLVESDSDSVSGLSERDLVAALSSPGNAPARAYALAAKVRADTEQGSAVTGDVDEGS